MHQNFFRTKGSEIIELNEQVDHVNLLALVLPKVFFSGYFGTVNGSKAIRIFNRFPPIKRKDAIYRLVINKRIKFESKPSVALEKGHYCPFNSQNTFWRQKTFPYLYLPAMTSFRFTDILRGYIAQRLIWEQDFHLGFTKATVYQKRNIHNIMKDFKDEIECYLNTKSIVELLDSLVLTSDSLLNLETVYIALSEQGFIKSKELDIFKAWLTDFNNVMGNNTLETKQQ